MTKPETMTIDMDPRQYINKVSAKDGSVIEGAYSPEQLLVSAHRDYHPADVTARMAMSQLVDFTGDESWVKKGHEADPAFGSPFKRYHGKRYSL